MLRPFAHPVALCCMLFGVFAQSLKLVKLLATRPTMLGVAASACTYLETIGRRNNNCFEKVQTSLLVQAIQEDRKKAEIGSIIYEVRYSPQYKMWLERI